MFGLNECPPIEMVSISPSKSSPSLFSVFGIPAFWTTGGTEPTTRDALSPVGAQGDRKEV